MDAPVVKRQKLADFRRDYGRPAGAPPADPFSFSLPLNRKDRVSLAREESPQQDDLDVCLMATTRFADGN